MTVAKPITAEPATPMAPNVAFAAEPGERLARLRLARSENVGPRTFLHLLRRFGSAEKALDALPALAARGGRAEYIPCPAEAAEHEFRAGQEAGAELILLGDPAFPPLLAQIDNPPPVLWTRGEPSLAAEPTVAIVGARNASALGLRTARRLAHELGAHGQVIVSGLARGIDTAAHESALENGTIAVLAGGLDQIYPVENTELAAEIAERGLLVSECAMSVEPTSRHFPRRNRLISGLSRAVLLIEAASRSGSLITARYALEQGREAMACPGAPDDPRSGGCNALIRDGAALIRSAEDVLECLEGPRTLALREDGTDFLFDDTPHWAGRNTDADAAHPAGLPDDEPVSARIAELLGPSPIDMDELARACGASPAELSLGLLELDLAGRIEIGPGGSVSLKMP